MSVRRRLSTTTGRHVLAGDIGGTKTLLGVFSSDRGPRRAVWTKEYRSADYDGLQPIVEAFLRDVDVPIEAACFDVAGPIRAGRATLTNLAWAPIDHDFLARRLGLPRVRLMNDLQAVATAVEVLEPRDQRVLHRGTPVEHGPVAIVAPGTGLGEAFVTWDGARPVAHASEGGHTDFGPNSELEAQLLAFLRGRHPHVSYELVCSGLGIANIYDFLAAAGIESDPPDLIARLADAPDRTRLIVDSAVVPDSTAKRSLAAVRLFAGILGAEAGNIGLKVLATGGIYLAGGLPPVVLPILREGPFLQRLQAKGRLSPVVSAMPVHVILVGAALLGSAAAALRDLPG